MDSQQGRLDTEHRNLHLTWGDELETVANNKAFSEAWSRFSYSIFFTICMPSLLTRFYSVGLMDGHYEHNGVMLHHSDHDCNWGCSKTDCSAEVMQNTLSWNIAPHVHHDAAGLCSGYTTTYLFIHYSWLPRLYYRVNSHQAAALMLNLILATLFTLSSIDILDPRKLPDKI